MSLEALYNITKSRVWGTVGPVSIEAGKAFAEFCGTKYALLLFSESAAMETLMRAAGVKAGDMVIAAEYSAPVDSLTALAVGADVVFAENDPASGAMSLESATGLIGKYGKKIKLLVYDNTTASAASAGAIYKLCRDNGIFVAANSGDNYKAKFFADAAVVNLGNSCVVDVGRAGAIITDNYDVYKLSFSYHHCGRPFGESETLNIDTIIGGDFRINEWQSSLIGELIAGAAKTADERAKAAEAAAARLPGSVKVLGIWEGSLGLVCTSSGNPGLEAGEDKFAHMGGQPVFGGGKCCECGVDTKYIWVKL